ncbi:hypothetical protein J6590_076221 [Homalodisca vitripennis]|nr:hypothetical protein J6590_076221 [Homalodisca vitripennis]
MITRAESPSRCLLRCSRVDTSMWPSRQERNRCLLRCSRRQERNRCLLRCSRVTQVCGRVGRSGIAIAPAVVHGLTQVCGRVSRSRPNRCQLRCSRDDASWCRVSRSEVPVSLLAAVFMMTQAGAVSAKRTLIAACCVVHRLTQVCGRQQEQNRRIIACCVVHGLTQQERSPCIAACCGDREMTQAGAVYAGAESPYRC